MKTIHEAIDETIKNRTKVGVFLSIFERDGMIIQLNLSDFMIHWDSLKKPPHRIVVDDSKGNVMLIKVKSLKLIEREES